MRLALASFVLAGCVVPSPKAALPDWDVSYVAVLSGQMPPPIDRVARHAWIVAHRAGPARFERYELGGGSTSDPFEDFAAGDVRVHGISLLSSEEVDTTMACLRREEKGYRSRHGYFPIPGPNSNTFVAELLRACSIPIALPSTAVGRDYVGIVGADVTESGTGIVLGSIPLTLRLGLKEGVEVGVLGLFAGVRAFPPAITLPIEPAEVGFSSDAHATRPCKEYCLRQNFERKPPDRAVGSMQLYGQGGAFSGAGSPSAYAAAGFSARGLYGGRIGYGVGLDFDVGGAIPLGASAGAHLYPLGVGYTISPTGYIGMFLGVGTWGASYGVPADLELPTEVRLEFDVASEARLAFLVRGKMMPFEPRRRVGDLLFDETTLGVYTRLGKAGEKWNFVSASGTYFGFERRELLDGALVSFVLGTQIDAALSRRSAKHREGR